MAIVTGTDSDDMIQAGTASPGVTPASGATDLADSISGLAGMDSLQGGAGNDTIDGGDGDDWLDGGAGADDLAGGAGNDTYVGVSADDQVFEQEDAGYDQIRSALSYTLPTGVEALQLTNAAANGTGNALSNKLVGNNAANLLYGLDGNDTIDAGPGDDTVAGGAGSDWFYGGGRGDDIYVFNDISESTPNAPDLLITFNVGSDRIDLSGIDADTTQAGNQDFILGGPFLAGHLRLTNVDALATLVEANTDGDSAPEFALIIQDYTTVAADYRPADFLGTVITEVANVVTGTDGDDTIEVGLTSPGVTPASGASNLADSISGLSGRDYIQGGAGDDNIAGGFGLDSLNGGAGNDIISGGDDDDFVDGGTGSDVLIGDLGNDAFIVDNVGDRVYERDEDGHDTVFSSVSFALPKWVEELRLTNNAAEGTGNALNNKFVGNNAANLIVGLDGNDTIDGGPGNDTAIGGIGSDWYFGGGRGNDVYVFNDVLESTPQAPDLIITFHSVGGACLLDLSGIDADTTQPGDQAFILGGPFVAGHLQLQQYGVNGRIFLSGNIDDDSAAEFLLRIDDRLPASSFGPGDFIL